ncbi:MAG: diguanylate cyclase [Elainella sp. C42_A2020_010]|nr:diguanylate cyclase [Elainella sp. C42_A2020_010]
MDASILLVGDENFRYSLFNLVGQTPTLTMASAADPLEAMPVILAQQPDLLLVQATQSDGLDLCQQVKAQSRLAWIYCILIATAAESMDRAREIELEAIALEVGADAYLQLPLLLFERKVFPNAPDLLAKTTPTAQLQRLLQAKIQAGLRQVRTYRELMRTNDVLSAIALSDPLTSLNNRRAFEWELPRQIQNARSRGIPISLIMLDVDFFKTINDTHGHLAGDQVLKFLAARLRHNLRIYDTPFRYGGEEFVIILSNTDSQEAFAIANRLCQLVSEQPFAIDDSLDLTVTISAGTATLRYDDDGKGLSLLQRADQCLLQAKTQGRNRVVGCGVESI